MSEAPPPDRPVRVALVTPRFPPDLGGLENYVGRLALLLQRTPGFEVAVVTTGDSARVRREEWHGVPVTRLGRWAVVSNTPVDPRWWWQVRRELRRWGADVVNAHAPVPGLADVAAYTSPVPVVTTYHAGSMVKGGPVDVLLRTYERAVLPRVFARSAALVAVSPVSLAHATGRAELLPPGVDVDLFAPQPLVEREVGALYVGRVERTSRWKGLDVLLEAWPRVLAAVPGARLHVAGDGDDVPRLRERARTLRLDEAVTWHGAVPHERLPDLYRRAGVTVLPSLTEAESFGMTLVEAMACACPVVGSAVGGIPFVVRDGVDGLVVPPGDVPAWADAISGLLLDPGRAAELGARGREAAVGRWAWEHQEQRTLAVLRDAARGGQPAASRKAS